jgi:DNA repair photolyase
MKKQGEPLYPDDAIPEPQHNGRGALSNASSRYDSETRIRTTDGWEAPAEHPSEDDELPPLRTTLTRDATRTILARNTSPDVPFDRSINPYRGCEHGCIYCFARPTHAYLGLSPGLDFETKILFKPDAAKLLAAELAAPKYRCDVVAMGTNTDPYQPVERELKVTRGIIRVLSEFNNPVGIVTKNHLVTRDIDILADMAKRNLAEVFLSVTTLDKELARTMEPRASAPHRRLEAIRKLADAGVPVGVMTAPMIPGLNDHEMESIL